MPVDIGFYGGFAACTDSEGRIGDTHDTPGFGGYNIEICLPVFMGHRNGGITYSVGEKLKPVAFKHSCSMQCSFFNTIF